MRTFEKKLEKAGFEDILEKPSFGGMRHFVAYRNCTNYDFYVDMLTSRVFYTHSITLLDDLFSQFTSDLHIMANFSDLKEDTNGEEFYS